MLCYVMLCYVMLCYVMLCYVMSIPTRGCGVFVLRVNVSNFQPGRALAKKRKNFSR